MSAAPGKEIGKGGEDIGKGAGKGAESLGKGTAELAAISLLCTLARPLPISGKAPEAPARTLESAQEKARPGRQRKRQGNREARQKIVGKGGKNKENLRVRPLSAKRPPRSWRGWPNYWHCETRVYPLEVGSSSLF